VAPGVSFITFRFSRSESLSVGAAPNGGAIIVNPMASWYPGYWRERCLGWVVYEPYSESHAGHPERLKATYSPSLVNDELQQLLQQQCHRLHHTAGIGGPFGLQNFVSEPCFYEVPGARSTITLRHE